MRESQHLLVEPAKLTFGPDGMAGGTDRYEKFLIDLSEIYRDKEAYRLALVTDSGDPAYSVESSSVAEGSGALTIGVSTVVPGQIGDEFAMTRGHIHAKRACAELYYGLSGQGVMLMESIHGETRAMEITPGVAVHVPGHWIHRSVNVGRVPFSTLFCYPTDAGQDYEIIGDASGMKQLVIATDQGWALRENRDHRGYAQTAKAGDR